MGDDASEELCITYYAVQCQKGWDTPEVELFRAWFSVASKEGAPDNRPLHCEYAEYTDAQGYYHWVAVAYWRDEKRYQRWSRLGVVTDFWLAEERLSGQCGYFRERLSVPPERFENLLSSDQFKPGYAAGCPHMRGPVPEHNYWGGMRDRIALCATDPLDPPAEAPPPVDVGSFGRRLWVRIPMNLAVIRSGQHLDGVTGVEKVRYEQDIEPALKEGMDFLRDNPEETGCYSCRFMTETDVAGRVLPRTFSLAHFVSLGHLEEWAASHPTHLRIFDTFIGFARALGEQMKLRLWHEVAVLPEQDAGFEYVNCHPATGLLRCLPAKSVE
jgi:aldoxime dehydratase